MGGDLAELLVRHAATPEWRRTLTFLFCAVADEGSAERAIELYSRLLQYFEPAGLSARPAAALLLADCLEVAHARGWNLHPFAQPLRGACDHALHHLPPLHRAHLWRTLGCLGLDDRRGVGVHDGIPDIDWVTVPKGEFLFGDEKPQKMALHAFRIARYPVTNAQYRCFIDDGGYDDKAWWRGLEQPQPARPSWNYPNHPRERVSWHEATAFCRWLDARLHGGGLLKDTEQARLPTEHEWEKAARGTDGREYPWGEYADGRANIDETVHGGPHLLRQTSAVGLYCNGASPYGLHDMSGNVWEWCANKEDVKDKSMNALRLIRGGSRGNSRLSCRCAFRDRADPVGRASILGFRVCVARRNI